MYSELSETLSWTKPMPAVDELHSALQSCAARRFERFESRYRQFGGTAASKTIDRLRELPPAAARAVMSSPQGFFAACPACPIEDAGEYLNGAVAVEAYRLGEQTHTDGEYWSSLGDACYSVAEEEGRISYAAPLLGGFLPLDTRCPATRREIPGVPNHSTEISADDEHRIHDVFDRAFAIIDATNSQAIGFVADFGRVLVVRQDPLDPGSHSAGARVTPGRMVMTNPLLRSDTPECLADFVIHEAIHCAIDHCEVVSPILRGVGFAPAIRSPWTGKLLDVNTFVQACFVWYGLVHFWRTARSVSELCTPGSEQMLAQAESGFRRADPGALLEAHSSEVNPEVIEVVRAMRID